jgi:1-acyl-sn-glycerol-3-phosphate acyltransferase
MTVAYWIFKALLSPLFFLFWRVRVEGREHVPSDGAVVLAPNHQSFCDSFFLPLVLRRPDSDQP